MSSSKNLWISIKATSFIEDVFNFLFHSQSSHMLQNLVVNKMLYALGHPDFSIDPFGVRQHLVNGHFLGSGAKVTWIVLSLDME